MNRPATSANIWHLTRAGERLIGKSDAVHALEEEVSHAARSDAKVVITGESGVGKEVVAGLIHRLSPRRQAPVVNINCAGLPDALLGSELFGHVRGSFTDAYRDRPGLLESANGGTVFLDEIGEMSMQMQAVLLRFLETGEIQRIGAHRTETRVDVRVICATNKSLIDQIKAKKFREDLYYRLNVIHLVIPPLRARREDIPLFLTHFLTSFSKHHGLDRVPELADDALEALVAYAWPGNVRELKNVIERLIVRNQSEKIELASLSGEIVSGSPMQAPAAGPLEPRTSDTLFDRMVKEGESFWSAVYPIFMSRDLTRVDLRLIVKRGLEQTRGSYKLLGQLFNMKATDYKRFLNFLRKYDCHMPFQRFRTLSIAGKDGPEERAADGLPSASDATR